MQFSVRRACIYSRKVLLVECHRHSRILRVRFPTINNMALHVVCIGAGFVGELFGCYRTKMVLTI